MISNSSAIKNTHFLVGVNKAGHFLDVISLRHTLLITADRVLNKNILCCMN